MDKLTKQRTANFLNLFNFAVDPKASGTSRIIPTKQVRDSHNHSRTIRDALSPNAKQLFDVWNQSMYFDRNEAKDRQRLFEDMDRAYFNSAIIGKAVKLTADEVVQADLNTLPIGVEAGRKQRKFILDLFDKIGLYYKVHSLAEDVILYGNAGLMPGFDSKGISEVTSIDVYDIKDRIEFNAADIEKQLRSSGSLLYRMQSYQRIDALIKSIQTSETYNADFKPHLFGFQIGEEVVAPWRFIHFRNHTSKNPFRPFGMPMYMNSIAPYRQYDAGLSLQVAARGARFPIDKYELNFPETLNPTTKVEKVLEFINQIENSGMRGVPKEGIGIGERIVTIKDLFDFDQIVPNIDIGRIDDLDLLKEDLIESTDIPANFFIAGKDGWGNSGISLVQQYKPFARRVYRVQSILLEGLTQLVKIAMIQSNQFSLDEIDFILTMPYPESQTSPEVITSQGDLISLANTVLDSLADKLFGGTAAELPVEVIRQVYHQILPYDQSRIDSWINTIEKDRNKMNKEMEKQAQEIMDEDTPAEIDYNSFGSSFQNHSYKVKHIETYRKLVEAAGGNRRFSEMLKTEIYEAKQENFREYGRGGKHSFSSKNRVDDFPAEKLVELDKQRVEALGALKEEASFTDLQKFNDKYKDVIPYRFTSKAPKKLTEYSQAKQKRYHKFTHERVDRIKLLAIQAASRFEDIKSEQEVK